MNVPERAAEQTRRQVEDYLGKSDLTGIPLLDSNIDWGREKNWPDEFVFEGRTYRLEISAYLDPDQPPQRLNTREAIPPGTSFGFVYEVELKPEGVCGIFPRGSWDRMGRVEVKTFLWGNRVFFTGIWRTVFQQVFYPNGALQKLHCERKDTGSVQVEFFDRDGNLLGRKDENGCIWEGQPITETEFNERSFEIWDTVRKETRSLSLFRRQRRATLQLIPSKPGTCSHERLTYLSPPLVRL